MAPYTTIPPFPDGLLEVPLRQLSLGKLERKDEAEAARLVDACRTTGFFYLDLSDDKEDSTLGKQLLQDADDLVDTAKQGFRLPTEEKQRYELSKTQSLFGYKAKGAKPKNNFDSSKAVPDTVEFFNVARDHVLNATPPEDISTNGNMVNGNANGDSSPLTQYYPSLIKSHFPLYKSFMLSCETISKLVLDALSKGLDVESSQFRTMHRGHSSTSMLRLTQTLSSAFLDGEDGVSTPPHSDFGSVTVLFNWIGGLQIQLPPGVPDSTGGTSAEPRWAYVRPLKNHVIINLGDVMVELTKGKLKSGPHRVIAPPGEHRNLDRYSVVYFLRPENDAKMVALKEYRGEGETEETAITAHEWVLQKFKNIGAIRD
ncbi:MAG: hypothetical protein Q9227_000901 [Pyrenula ochraceoflavens]